MDRRAIVLFGLPLIALHAAIPAAEPQGPRPTRALPPKWPKSVADVFFSDARAKLIGKRPNYPAVSSRDSHPVGPSTTEGSDLPAAATGEFAWSKLISPETIEDEIKSLQKQVSENVTTPANFKGGGFKAGRRHFTELALLFAIIAQYDGQVRWKDKSGGIRDLMGRAGQNCAVGTDASYNEARLRKEDLEQLVQGALTSAPAADPDARWDKIADRAPLMQRIEQAQQQGVAPWTANPGEFSKNASALLREAELISAVAETIQREGYSDSDDETYLGFARKMRDAAMEVAAAVRGKNYDAARAASGNIEKACSGCHEQFRS